MSESPKSLENSNLYQDTSSDKGYKICNYVTINAYVETIDENVNIEMEIFESNDDLLQVFTIRAKRKKLRLKDVAAYNVAQMSQRKQIKPFVIEISGDYIFDLNEN